MTYIAVHNDEVIGAAYTGWHYDSEKIVVYSFDIVVHPKFQGFENVGIKLIQAAEKERNEIENATETKVYTKLWVVNPKLARVLQSRRFNYESIADYKDGSAHLVKY